MTKIFPDYQSQEPNPEGSIETSPALGSIPIPSSKVYDALVIEQSHNMQEGMPVLGIESI